MSICMIGLNHTTADVELRSKFAFRKSEMKPSLVEVSSYPHVDAAVIVSTCNRTEIYATGIDSVGIARDLREFLIRNRGVSSAELNSCIYEYADEDAVHHLFTVVSSLDSMVLGEQQIIGQIRTAFIEAAHSGHVNLALSRLFRQAMECGKRVRSQTSISESHVSVSTVAIDIAKRTFDDLADKRVLIVGAGEASELAARYLKEQGVGAFIVSSRTREHALMLADELGGEARRFDDLDELVCKADIIVSGTAAPHCIIDPDMLVCIKEKLLILDIAVPRDVDPGCAKIPGVVLCDLDDIGREIEKNKSSRIAAAEHAKKIVDEETETYMKWLSEYAITPVVKEMRLKAERVRKNELEHLLRVLDVNPSEHDLAALEAATSAIVNKILHDPTVRVRSSANERNGFETIDAARYLFDLDGIDDGIDLRSNEKVDGAEKLKEA